ncbi:TIGR03620 family F420-dependent LLM class oxidoreductase [Nocardia sp. R6R-6]|uniref:TIGR03620 family F420-dependent LLM class oxidoreductase n=1 Tax=Nocardia sp. R6R-6 TaxID=3459303 RepID=UPI00403E33D9
MTGPRRAVPPLPRVGIWTDVFDFLPIGRARELAAELESLGFGSVWLPEMVGRDPFVQLSMLLSATRRMTGATGIASIWARDPITTACAANTLTEAFPDRVLVGLGVSHRSVVVGMRGHDYRKPLTAMRVYLDAIAAAPYSAVPPAAPARYMLAALRPRMLELAGTRTAGAHPYLVTPEHTASARLVLGAGPMLCPEQTVVVESDRAKARAIARRFLSVYLTQPNYLRNLRELGFTEADFGAGGSDRLVDALVVHGDIDSVVARVNEHRDAGADQVAVQVLSEVPGEPPIRAWRELAAALPAIRG